MCLSSCLFPLPCFNRFAVHYLSHGHFFVAPRLPYSASRCLCRQLSPTWSFSLNTFLVFRTAHALVSCAPRPTSLLPSTLPELPIIRPSERLSGVAFRTRLTAPMPTICGNMTVSRGTASVSEQGHENARICFFFLQNWSASIGRSS